MQTPAAMLGLLPPDFLIAGKWLENMLSGFGNVWTSGAVIDSSNDSTRKEINSTTYF